MSTNNHSISIQISTEKQGTEAYLSIRGQPYAALSADDLKEKIHSYGVVYGLDFAAIEEARLRYRNAKTHANIRVLIARGKPVVQGRDGEIEYLIQESKGVVISETGQADFRNIGKYHPVKAGELLARRTPAVQGTKGVRVNGEIIAPEPVSDPELRCGNNVVASPDGLEYRAKVSGIYVRDRNFLDVNPVLVISGNVGLETGNISYEGDIVVRGSIEAESKVETQANLEVQANVDSHMLVVGSDLSVRGGITSGHHGAIEVQGSATVGFIEHSTLHARSGIVIKRSAISCTLVSGAGISLTGKGSMLAGGEITAFGDILAEQIGNKSGIITKIYLGTHYFIAQELEEVLKELEDATKRHNQLTHDIEKIKLFAARVKNQIPEDKKQAFMKVFSEYKLARDRYQNLGMKSELLSAKKVNRDDVVISARESFYPGVEVHFAGFIKRIEQKTGPLAYRFRYAQREPVAEMPALK